MKIDIDKLHETYFLDFKPRRSKTVLACSYVINYNELFTNTTSVIIISKYSYIENFVKTLQSLTNEFEFIERENKIVFKKTNNVFYFKSVNDNLNGYATEPIYDL